MKTKDPDIILSRFNRQISVAGRYNARPGKLFDGVPALIEFRKDEGTYTLISEKSIFGKTNDEDFSISLVDAALNYELIDMNGSTIEEKGDVGIVEAVKIDNGPAVFVPTDAVFPFLNLLLFLSSKKRK